MVDSNCKGASVPDYNKSEGAKLGSFVINQRSGASKCRKTWNTTSHFDSQPLVNLVNYQSNFREEACFLCLSRAVCPIALLFPDRNFYFHYLSWFDMLSNFESLRILRYIPNKTSIFVLFFFLVYQAIINYVYHFSIVNSSIEVASNVEE